MKKMFLSIIAAGFAFLLNAQLMPNLQRDLQLSHQSFQAKVGEKTRNPFVPLTQDSVIDQSAFLVFNNLLDSTHSYYWVSSTNEWLPKYRTIYSQDCEIGKPTMLVGQKLNMATGQYVDSVRQVFTYFDNGSQKTYLNEIWIANSNTWVELDFNSYFAPNKLEVSRRKTVFDNTTTIASGDITNFYYDADSLLIQTEYIVWYGGNNWVPQVRQTRTYNSEKLLADLLFESFDMGQNAYNIAGKEVYSYDNSGSLILIDHQFIQQGQLTVTSRDHLLYNQEGYLIEEFSENFNPNLQAFVKNDKKIYLRNQLNQLLEEQYYYFPTPGDTMTIFNGKNLHNYYPSGNRSSIKTYLTTTNGIWYQSALDSILEDGRPAYLRYSVGFDDNTGTYSFGYRSYSTYDNEGKVSGGFYDEIIPNTNIEWKLVRRTLYEYDDQSLLVERKFQLWQQAAGDYVNSQKLDFFNTACNTSRVFEAGENEVDCIHANPLSNGQPISCPGLENGGALQLMLFDLMGRKIHQMPFENGSKVEGIGQLPTGIYVLTISGLKGVFYREKVLISPK